MAMADGTGYLVNLIYYASADTLKMVVQIPVPCPMALTSLLGSKGKGFLEKTLRNFKMLRTPNIVTHWDLTNIFKPILTCYKAMERYCMSFQNDAHSESNIFPFLVFHLRLARALRSLK